MQNMQKNIVIMIIAIVAIVMTLGPTVCNAEIGGAAPLPKIKKSTGPSFDETTKWIAAKIASISINSPLGYLKNYTASFSGCEMLIVEKAQIDYNSNGKLTVNYNNKAFKLHELDERKFKYGQYSNHFFLSFYALGGEDTIVSTQHRYTAVGHTNYFNIDIPDIAMAESLMNAFKRAIELCQQKTANDKAAQPAVKKDLF